MGDSVFYRYDERTLYNFLGDFNIGNTIIVFGAPGEIFNQLARESSLRFSETSEPSPPKIEKMNLFEKQQQRKLKRLSKENNSTASVSSPVINNLSLLKKTEKELETLVNSAIFRNKEISDRKTKKNIFSKTSEKNLFLSKNDNIFSSSRLELTDDTYRLNYGLDRITEEYMNVIGSINPDNFPWLKLPEKNEFISDFSLELIQKCAGPNEGQQFENKQPILNTTTIDNENRILSEIISASQGKNLSNLKAIKKEEMRSILRTEGKVDGLKGRPLFSEEK